MKLPLSVLMYRLTEDYDCGYRTVNVDVSSEYDGIKLMDESLVFSDSGRYLYLTSEKEFTEKYDSLILSGEAMSEVFICLCPDEESAICTTDTSLSVVYLFADVKFAYIFNSIQNIMKKFDEWEKSFHLSVLRSYSMQELIDITESLMTHPLVVFDNNYSLLGHTRDMTEVGPLMRGVIRNGYASPADMKKLADEGIVSILSSQDTVRISRYRLAPEKAAARGLDRDTFYSITYRFAAGGRTVGYAVAFHCLSHPTNGYLYLMNMIADKLLLYFEQNKKNDGISREAYQTFLAGILADPDMPARQLYEQAGHIHGLKTEGRFLLAQLRYDSIDEMSYSFISWSLRNSMPQFMPFVYRNSFYVLKVCGGSMADAAAGIKGEKCLFLTEKEKPLFYKCFRNIAYTCGVSSMFFSLNELKTAAVQCREALSAHDERLWNSQRAAALYQYRISRHEERTEGKTSSVRGSRPAEDAAGQPGAPDETAGRGSFYYYDDMAFLHLIAQLRRTLPPELLRSPYYRLLEAYDAAGSTDLCHIMARYIACGCSITKTAAATYMHRNTIQNKIKRAADIMGDELGSFTSQVLFMISYLDAEDAGGR